MSSPEAISAAEGIRTNGSLVTVTRDATVYDADADAYIPLGDYIDERIVAGYDTILASPDDWVAGDIFVASAARTMARLTAVAAGSVLLSGGLLASPTWGAITNAHVDASAAIAYSKLEAVPATAAALTSGLALKANLASPTFTGTVALPTTTHSGAATFASTVGITGALTVASDTDSTTILGRARIHSASSDIAMFSHVDMSTQNNYALRQASSGNTTVNAPTGSAVAIAIHNSGVVVVTSSGASVTGTFAASGDVAINTNKFIVTASSGAFTAAGAATLSVGAVGTPSLNFGDAATGFYRVTANQIGIAINGALRGTWKTDELILPSAIKLTVQGQLAVTGTSALTGNVGIGGASTTGGRLTLTGTLAGAGTSQLGLNSDVTFPAAATAFVRGVVSRVTTANTSYTVTHASAFYAQAAALGTGSTITTGYGVYVEPQAVAATNWAIFCESSATSGGVTFRSSALATNATTGYLHIPSCVGVPTGVPANIPTGQIPIVYDSTNDKIYVYRSGWKATAALA